MIPYGRQDINQSDIQAVVDVLGSDFLTQGPKVTEFEAAIAKETNSKYAVAVNSATSALHIACLALDLGPGDTLWTSPVTFVASSNCALYCGADVDFVDIDSRTLNMCPIALEKKLEIAAQKGKLPKILVPVHLAGHSCDMMAISKLAHKYGIKVIEDASHAIGARYRDLPVGNCSYSDICVFSFHPVKIITSGEGGIATTNDADLDSKMKRFRSHGITRDPDLMISESHGPWYYQQLDLGYNYRMTDLHAALGLSQLNRLEEFVAERNRHATAYYEELSDLPLILPQRQNECYSSFHLYIIQLENPKQHKQVFQELRRLGIGVNLHYIPVHLQPYYQQLGFSKGDFPASEDYYSRAISIPLFSSMTDDERAKVVASIREVLSKCH